MRLFNLKSVAANTMALFLFSSASLSMVGCGQNMDSAFGRATATSTNGSQSQNSGGTPIAKVDPWANVDLQGVASNAVFGTHQIFQIDTVNNLLILSIPMPIDPFGITGSIPVPNIPGATISLANNGSGQTLNFSIPLQYLVKGLSFDNPQMLPNGDPLPAIPGGELPRIGANFQNSNFSVFVYGSVKYFALFIPTPGINPYLNLTFPIKNKAKTKVLGYVSTVAQKGTFDGGAFITLVFPPELSAVLDNLFH